MRHKTKHILLLSLLSVVLLLSACGKTEHKIAIYAFEGMCNEEIDYEDVIKDKTPILTEKDITAYNKDTMMLFLSDDVINKYRENLKITEKSPIFKGGSLILNRTGEGNVFVITVDDKMAMVGQVYRSLKVSCIPKGFHIKDGLGGLRIYLPRLDSKENMDDVYYKKLKTEYDALAKAFEDMDMLTDDVFDISSDYQNKAYNTNELWQNRTEHMGDNAKVGAIINNLVLPDGMEYKSFKINSAVEPYSVEIYLKEDKKLVNDIMNRTEEGKIAYNCLAKNAGILFTLVKNLSKVDFINDDNKTLDVSFVSKDFEEQFGNDTMVKNYLPIEDVSYDDIATIFDFYRVFNMDFTFDAVIYGDFFADEGNENENNNEKSSNTEEAKEINQKNDNDQKELTEAQEDVDAELGQKWQKISEEQAQNDEIIYPRPFAIQLKTSLDRIIESPKSSTIPTQYIDEHQKAFYELVKLAKIEPKKIQALQEKYEDSLQAKIIEEAIKEDLFLYVTDTRIVVNTNGQEKRVLTEKELDDITKAFATFRYSPSYDKEVVSPVSYLFTSYYEQPQDIDLSEILRVYMERRILQDDADNVDEKNEHLSDSEKFEKLKKLHADFFNTEKISDMPTPVGEIYAEDIDMLLYNYMGISLEDLSDKNNEEKVYYLEECNGYFTITSDFAGAFFNAESGDIDGIRLNLYNKHAKLVIQKSEKTGKWYIQSYIKK